MAPDFSSTEYDVTAAVKDMRALKGRLEAGIAESAKTTPTSLPSPAEFQELLHQQIQITAGLGSVLAEIIYVAARADMRVRLLAESVGADVAEEIDRRVDAAFGDLDTE